MRVYGLGKGTVLRLLENNGVPRRRQPMSAAEIEEAVRMYRQGWPLTRIGARLGRHHSVVRRVLAGAGVDQSGSGGQP